jgi:serine/threonine protein kinase
VGEPFLNLDRERSSSAEFVRVVQGGFGGSSIDIVDAAAAKVRSESFIQARLAKARQRAPQDACDLLEAMLTQDPASRITSLQALRHRFLADRPHTYRASHYPCLPLLATACHCLPLMTDWHGLCLIPTE